MYTKTLLAIASAALIGNAAAYENTPVIKDNPQGVTYFGILPSKPFFAATEIEGNVVGSISATAPEDGIGTKFTVKFSNFPKSGGPFIYHLHVKPAADGNCTATLGHLDPTKRGDLPACDNSKPSSCQVGDLSGKHGKITTDPFIAEFVDPFVSLDPDNSAFFGNASFVIHYANTTRLTCADFQLADSRSASPDCRAQPSSGIAPPSGSRAVGSSTVGKPAPTTPVIAGAAKMAVAAPLFAIGAAAMML